MRAHACTPHLNNKFAALMSFSRFYPCCWWLLTSNAHPPLLTSSILLVLQKKGRSENCINIPFRLTITMAESTACNTAQSPLSLRL